MNAPELQRLAQILSPFSGASIDLTFRALRARDLIPTSPRGGQPIDMQPDHAAWALMALAVDRAPEKAADVVAEWGAMRPRDNGTAFVTFGQALAEILADAQFSLRTIEVRICREWPKAVIIAGDRSNPATYTFGAETAAEAKAAGFRATPIRSEFILSGGALHQIAIDLASPEGGLFGGAAELVSVS